MRLLICSLVPRSQGPGDEATDMLVSSPGAKGLGIRLLICRSKHIISSLIAQWLKVNSRSPEGIQISVVR